MKARLALAWHRDRLERRVRRLGERLGWPQAWLREFGRLTGDPRLTMEEFWVRYAIRRERAQEQMAQVKTAEDARGFYATSDYLLYRQTLYRRHTPWRVVLAGMRAPYGRLVEFGCGIAPVAAWVLPRRPHWSCALVDMPSPQRDYAARRLPSASVASELAEWDSVDVAVALEVLEHLPDPFGVVERRLVRALAPGGLLYWNFAESAVGGLDLATPEQRDATLAYLEATLERVWDAPGLIVSRRPA